MGDRPGPRPACPLRGPRRPARNGCLCPSHDVTTGGETLNKIIASLLAALALGASLAACGSSSTTATTKSGTETFYGKVTGKAAITNSTVFALTFKGPVNTQGTLTLSGSGPKKGQCHTFPP